MAERRRRGGHHQGGCSGYAFGFNHDTTNTISLSGQVIIDSTFVMLHYYLDENNDSTPDYFLNFGPPWYEPASGAKRPTDGDQINIIGGLTNNAALPMVIVYELNGLEWRDTTLVGFHFGGGWVHRNMTDSSRFHSPFDENDWMNVTPGWHRGGGMQGGGMMADSLFCQILEVYPQNIPQNENENILCGYEIGIFQPDGSNGMWPGGGCGGHMNFNSNFSFNLHYNETQGSGFNITENNLKAKYWDNQSNTWVEVSGAIVDASNGTVSFSLNKVSNFIILTTEKQTTGIESITKNIPQSFTLKQNYPNPFNPATTIEFDLKENSKVELTIYNALGQKIKTLVDREFSSGRHKINFNAHNLTSGIYFYELKTNNSKQIKKMELLK